MLGGEGLVVWQKFCFLLAWLQNKFQILFDYRLVIHTQKLPESCERLVSEC